MCPSKYNYSFFTLGTRVLILTQRNIGERFEGIAVIIQGTFHQRNANDSYNLFPASTSCFLQEIIGEKGGSQVSDKGSWRKDAMIGHNKVVLAEIDLLFPLIPIAFTMYLRRLVSAQSKTFGLKVYS